ncbi:hypothetical protein QL285_014154 [Trifolium repens]|nr:hypothetical protein QL285_014154 [Trifolium repens]
MQPCLSYDRQNVPTQSPPPKPSDGAVLNHFLPPNGVDIQNYLMLSPPPKPLDPSFQLKQGEFQVTWDLAWPPPPPDVSHIFVVLQEFLTLKFSKLTDLSCLQWNGYSVK